MKVGKQEAAIDQVCFPIRICRRQNVDVSKREFGTGGAQWRESSRNVRSPQPAVHSLHHAPEPLSAPRPLPRSRSLCCFYCRYRFAGALSHRSSRVSPLPAFSMPSRHVKLLAFPTHNQGGPQKMDRNARDLPDWVVQREVLAKQRRVLLVYGVGHLWRKSPKANFESAGPAASLVSLLEGTHGARVSLFHTTAARFPSGPSDRTRPPGPVAVHAHGGAVRRAAISKAANVVEQRHGVSRVVRGCQRTRKCVQVAWCWPSGRAINSKTIAARCDHQ